MKIKLHTFRIASSCIFLYTLSMLSMEQEHPRKHALPISTIQKKTSIDGTQETLDKKTKREALGILEPDGTQLIPYTPTSPTTNENATLYGLKLVAHGATVGTIHFEVSPEDPDDEEGTGPFIGDITHLLIQEKFQHKGYGSILLKAACDALETQGCSCITLTAAPTKRSLLPALLRFYHKAGFCIEQDFDLAQIDKDPTDDYVFVPMFKQVSSGDAQ